MYTITTTFIVIIHVVVVIFNLMCVIIIVHEPNMKPILVYFTNGQQKQNFVLHMMQHYLLLRPVFCPVITGTVNRQRAACVKQCEDNIYPLAYSLITCDGHHGMSLTPPVQGGGIWGS